MPGMEREKTSKRIPKDSFLGKEERVKYFKSPITEDRGGDKLMSNTASQLWKQNVLVGKYLVFKNSQCGKAR